ncbi:hypothetical protein BD769DRAFT_1467603, partial [Suillus cothurnatus]
TCQIHQNVVATIEGFAVYISRIADTSTHWLSMTLIPRFLQASESQRDSVDAESSNTANPPCGNPPCGKPPGNSPLVTAPPVTVPNNTPGGQYRTLALTDRRGLSNDGKFRYLNLLTSLTCCFSMPGNNRDILGKTQGCYRNARRQEILQAEGKSVEAPGMAGSCTATSTVTILAKVLPSGSKLMEWHRLWHAELHLQNH